MSTLEAGQVFGRYTIINAVSAHESVETYRAYDSTISRDVTLKVFTRQASADPALNERFHRGVIALLDLTHPHILDIHDAGEIDGLLYLAMPLVEGETVAQRLVQGDLSAEDVDRIVRQTGEAIQFAHAHDITHGRLDLDSLLLDSRGSVVVGDFGLGSLLSGEPPEAARRRDVLLLGGLALALMTGKALAERGAPLVQRLQPWIERLPPSVREAAKARIEGFLAKAVSPQAADRFNSVADFLAEWARLRAEGGPSTPAPSAAAAVTPAQQDAARRAAAEAQAQARTTQYERQRAERFASTERTAVEARARVQRETAERDGLVRRAAERRDALLGPAVVAERARHATLSHLLRAINAVAAKRANTVGIPYPIARRLDVDVEHARSPIQTVKATPAASSARPLPQPRIDLQKESARLQREARARAATEAQTITRGIRRAAVIVGIVIFLVFCVVPAACLSLLIAIPDTAVGTPVPASTTEISVVVATPIPPPTAVNTRAATSLPTATQRPTITPFVRPTNTASAPPVSSVLIFSDTFQSASCRLPQFNTAQGSALCADGEYRLLTRSPEPLLQGYPPAVGDITIEADVRAIVSRPSLEYGIIWGLTPERYSAFTITTNGDAAVFDVEGPRITYRIKGLNSSAIGKGSATNRLRVTVNGERLTFAVNGRALPFSFSDDAPSVAQFGFVVIAAEPGAQVGFSRLNVWELRPFVSPSQPPTPAATR